MKVVYYNYGVCYGYQIFDGIFCEILFNTFYEWRITMFSFSVMICWLLVYPITGFFLGIKNKIQESRREDMENVIQAYIFAVI